MEQKVSCTCLETPGLVGHAACCSFSKRPRFLDTSSSRNRVLWVTSGDRVTSDFYMHTGGGRKKHQGYSEIILSWHQHAALKQIVDLRSLSESLHLLLDGPGWNPLLGAKQHRMHIFAGGAFTLPLTRITIITTFRRGPINILAIRNSLSLERWRFVLIFIFVLDQTQPFLTLEAM